MLLSKCDEKDEEKKTAPYKINMEIAQTLCSTYTYAAQSQNEEDVSIHLNIFTLYIFFYVMLLLKRNITSHHE